MPRLVPIVVLLIACSAARAHTPEEEIARQAPAAVAVLDAYHADRPEPAERLLHLVYWTPADREPAAQYRERLSRVMRDIQSFYRGQMKGLGLGERTIRLATDADGWVRIHLVKGAKDYTAYDVKSGDAIRRECRPVLAAAGIDADKETVVIFCNMSNWDPQKKTMSQNSPYYAGGGLRGGTAWQVDSPLLDPDLLAKNEPLIRDGQYGRISVGKYNSIFVGGVCHELGHALGLPHNSERPEQRDAFGTALMGGGNRTYGDDRRGEGRGSFLTLAEGLRLASHPMFSGSVKGIDLPATAKLEDVAVERAADGRAFTFSARAVTPGAGDPPVYAVVGYLDPAGGQDYDAPTVTAVPGRDGRFTLDCAALKPGRSGVLRVVACQANGGRIGDKTFSVPYDVSKDGVVDVTAFRAAQQLAPLVKAVNASDADAAREHLARLESAAGADARIVEVARVLAGTTGARPGPAPADATGDACMLSDAASRSARVGWGKPTANRLPGDTALIRVNGRLFARGLYAHAPSAYRYDLGGRWKTLTAHAGVADGNDGSVVFVVLGDGKELLRSKPNKGESLLDVSLAVEGVNELELRVENAGDGNAGDWGVWCEPKVTR